MQKFENLSMHGIMATVDLVELIIMEVLEDNNLLSIYLFLI